MIEERNDFNKLTGFYRGKVLKHLPHGKCKVMIYGVYDPSYEGNPDCLPDAELITPQFGGSNFGNGVFSYPNIGAIVRCGFWNGDANLPWFDGVCLGGGAAKHKFEEVANELDEETGEEPSCIHMISVGKTKLKFYEGGLVELTVAGEENCGGIILDKEGNIFICCDKTLQIQAEDIKMIAKNRFDLVANDITTTAIAQNITNALNTQILSPSGFVLVKSQTSPSGKLI